MGKFKEMPMTTWIMDKVLMFLTNHEGVELIEEKDNYVVIQDAFGYRYQIEIKAISRIDNQELNHAGISYIPTVAITKVME